MATTPPPGTIPVTYRSSTPPTGREVHIASREVQPPTYVYLQAEDQLTVETNIPVLPLPVSISIRGRFLRPDGEIVGVQKTLLATTTLSFISFSMGEGTLLSINAFLTSLILNTPGAIFCTIFVSRDTPDINVGQSILCSDYITTAHNPSWPFGRAISPQDGTGRVRSITGTTQAAGVDISETVPANVRWNLLAFTATLTTSATVANRTPIFLIDDGVNILSVAEGINTQAASLLNRYSLSPVVPSQAVIGGNISIGFTVPILLAAGFRIRSSTINLQAGDQWSAPQYAVQEWVEQ